MALDFLWFKMKNLNKRPVAFYEALTKRKEQTCEITVKTARNFHFRTKKFAKMDELRVQAKKRREG